MIKNYMIDSLIKPEFSKEEWTTPEVQLMQVSENTLGIPDPNEGDPSGPDPLGS